MRNPWLCTAAAIGRTLPARVEHGRAGALLRCLHFCSLPARSPFAWSLLGGRSPGAALSTCRAAGAFTRAPYSDLQFPKFSWRVYEEPNMDILGAVIQICVLICLFGSTLGTVPHNCLPASIYQGSSRPRC